MSRMHETVVGDQFGPRAKAYVESAVHAAGEDLDLLETIARQAKPRWALDLGTGGGHVAYRLARHAEQVTATDLSADMLAAVAAKAKADGLDNIDTRQAPAERLSLPDASVDFLACRYSAHHWRDFQAGLREARRVAKPQAPAVFIDAYAPGMALLDTHLQAVELLARHFARAQSHAGGMDGGAGRGWICHTRLAHLATAHGFSGLDRPHAHAGGKRARHPRVANGGVFESARAFRHRAGRLVHARYYDDRAAAA